MPDHPGCQAAALHNTAASLRAVRSTALHSASAPAAVRQPHLLTAQRLQVHEVTEYRRAVYAAVRDVLATAPGLESPPIKWEDPEWALVMAMEHERIHLETSSVLVRELPLRLLRPPPQVRAAAAKVDVSCGSWLQRRCLWGTQKLSRWRNS